MRFPTVIKRVHRDRAYFSITWAPLQAVSRQRINAAVPSMPGIWELYQLENSRVPHLLKMGAAWLGGVRHKLRSESDPGLPANRNVRDTLESGDCYFRYSICENRDDLVDVYDVLLTIRGITDVEVTTSGRYRDVRIEEPEEMLIHRVRTPTEQQKPLESNRNEVPNMFDVLRELRALEAEKSEAENREIDDTGAADMESDTDRE